MTETATQSKRGPKPKKSNSANSTRENEQSPEHVVSFEHECSYPNSYTRVLFFRGLLGNYTQVYMLSVYKVYFLVTNCMSSCQYFTF